MSDFPTTTLAQVAQSPAADAEAIALLTETQDFETAFDAIIAAKFSDQGQVFDGPSSLPKDLPTAIGYTPDPKGPKPSLWKIFLKRVQQEICGTDDSLRSLIQETKKNPGNATLVTGVITALVNLSGFPLPIDSAIATAIALYLIHIGIDVFCEWTTPPATPPAT